MAADAAVAMSARLRVSLQIDVFDAMPSVARKFLLAGIGGLNLTHSEAFEPFVQRYGAGEERLRPLLEAFGAPQLCDFAAGLGVETFVGSSGRVFPKDLKAAPLLRAWLHRLRVAGVRFHMRHRWQGGGLSVSGAHRLGFDTPLGAVSHEADAVVLALGGGSWPKLGSDGAWPAWLQAAGVPVAPLRPANCGFDLATPWSDHLRAKHAGAAVKSVALHIDAPGWPRKGEFVLNETGIEGSLVYAASAWLRDEISAHGQALAHVDLLPDRSVEWVRAELAHGKGARSWATHLKTRLHLHGAKTALLYELVPKPEFEQPDTLAQAIKHLPLRLDAPRPLAEAISSAGGVVMDAVDTDLQCNALHGVYCAGEMLDWEAPTGGYLLTACMSTGQRAGACAARALFAGQADALAI